MRANRVTIERLTITGFSQAFDVNGVSDFTAQNNRVLSSTATGIGVISTCTNVRLLDNVVDSAAGLSIALHGNTNVLVARNIITNGGDDGIAVRALTGNAELTVIADNIINDAGKAGIKLTVESSSTAGTQNFRASITGNVIKKWARLVTESAITVNNSLSDGSLNQNISVANNSMESANRSAELSYITAINTKDIAITGNIGRGGVNAAGIVLQGASYFTMTGNIMADACKVSSATNTGGIQILTSNYGTVQGNTVRNPGKSGTNRPGIYVEQSQYLAVEGNTCIDDQGGSATISY